MTAVKPKKDGSPLWQAAPGVFLVVQSALAVVISVGAPGIGWMLAVVTLYVGGLAARRIARGQLLAVFVIALLHLFLFGPFAGFRWISGNPGAGLVIFFVALPLVTAALALCLPMIWRRKDLISDRS